MNTDPLLEDRNAHQAVIKELRKLANRLKAAEPSRKELLKNLRFMSVKLNSARLIAIKDRLTAIEEAFNNSAHRHCSFVYISNCKPD